ncbi:MAG: transcriptional regulator [Streptomycetaceae bacterium]|nr:transcriptional regulator [Streptomycetaceae bacterium]
MSDADDKFPGGPLAVLEASGDPAVPFTAYLTGGTTAACPARTMTELAAWAIDDMGMGSSRLDRNGDDEDPLLVLTASATEFLGLPPEFDDTVNQRLPATHPVVKAIAKAGWLIPPHRGFGPWVRLYQKVDTGRRCTQFAILPWGALDTRLSWKGLDRFAPDQVADALGLYAARVIRPRGTAAVNGISLMEAVRPRSRAVKKADGTGYEKGEVPGSLRKAVDPAPPEAPEEHPVAQNRHPDDVMDEEALDWVRPFENITADEGALPYAVGVDVNTAFLAAANGLTLGLGAPEHVDRPAFDKRIPGCWQVDLSDVDFAAALTAKALRARKPEAREKLLRMAAVDFARLPNPFTTDGLPPDRPGWYTTQTLAYAVELGIDVRPTQGWLRLGETGPYLQPWYNRIRDAYIATMADLGVPENLPPAEFLEAMRRVPDGDPVLLAVLAAIKATVKSGLGKLRERPQGIDYTPGERWPALDRPLWRPDFRAADISGSRVNMNRKILNTAAIADRYPLAVATDCIVYGAVGTSPLDALAYTGDTHAPGTFQIGVNPGYVKHEGTQSMAWALDGLDRGVNIARHVKSGALPKAA